MSVRYLGCERKKWVQGSGEEGELELNFDEWMQFKPDAERNISCLCVGKRYVGVELRVVYTERGQSAETLTLCKVMNCGIRVEGCDLAGQTGNSGTGGGKTTLV